MLYMSRGAVNRGAWECGGACPATPLYTRANCTKRIKNKVEEVIYWTAKLFVYMFGLWLNPFRKRRGHNETRQPRVFTLFSGQRKIVVAGDL